MSSAIQDFLFRRIKEKLPAEASLADEIAEQLHGEFAQLVIRERVRLLQLLERVCLVLVHQSAAHGEPVAGHPDREGLEH